ncbi:MULTISPECIES: outer membrane protein assembly factor BamD [Mesoflavibacter]|uniref:Outer membrane protein assembly factor BamD n=1 Tax=Mesoflavibacter profundi TaxID=2708110 RepID=A0ABT4RYI2_9FLAO|nr:MULTISPECIES: outer membrane protein assembly factor BamD [Mesoflavibacter]MDA0176879.1 outer membrane protein assembly factor BamD [Mesoflavibacter profundi]QIJ90522.1 Outer membrane assembly lipoprotein YfiO [Mesoflavibacter sp. HG96]QIJ93250.1 Outer membrane assembly lipoprotein YfiO [Mesoflavibacter sp. HG37]
MKHLIYILVALVFFNSCSEYQKVLKSEDIAAKFQLGEQLYNEGKYTKANRLFEQIVPAYRGKPQAEKLMFLYADTYYQTGEEYLAGYQFERFTSAYPRSEKLEEAYYKSAMSYAALSPVYSKDQHETQNALEKLQLFANLYPSSSHMPEINKTVKDLEYKLELKAYSIAKQYNHITDYKASIKTFDNFIADFPGSTLREKALYYRFDSAYRLAINSVEYKKKQRLEDAITYYNAFKRLYSGSEFIADADKMNEDLKEQLQKYSTNI